MTEEQRFVLAWALVVALLLWSYLWKGIALWMAARRDHVAWYVVLAILMPVPEFGAVEMLYVLAVARRQPDLVETVGPGWG